MADALPEYKNPPVIEVVLGVQFEQLTKMKVPQVGVIWNAFRNRFPNTEEQPPLQNVVERFSSPGTPVAKPGVRLEFGPVPPAPRVLFINERGTELLQVQHDRFIRNWRKNDDDDPYPRYHELRESFRSDYETFKKVVEQEGWGPIEPNQCEVTYVNLIASGDVWTDHSELHKVITLFRKHYSDDYLGTPEDATLGVRYVLYNDQKQPIGRLHVDVTPVTLIADKKPALRLNLTVRGQPADRGIKGVLSFLDRGHEEIVRSFTSVTTPEMHKIWSRTQ